MHPFEDFAETWAHYLHICDTDRDGRRVRPDHGRAGHGVLAASATWCAGVWVPLSIALNMINRSMGKDDLYPFVIPAPVLDKLDFVACAWPGR